MNRKCTYCGKTFRREHIYYQHVTNHCPHKKSVPERDEKSHREQIENSIKMIKQYDGKFMDEAITMTRNLIKLKNAQVEHHFNCKYCTEGFMFQSELLDHQRTCFFKPAESHESRPDLEEKVQRQEEEIRHLQGLVKELRDKVKILDDVREELESLKECRFQLQLFKNTVL